MRSGRDPGAHHERRTIATGRERAGVAMGQHTAAGGDQRRAEIAHAPIGGDVLGVNALRLRKQPWHRAPIDRGRGPRDRDVASADSPEIPALMMLRICSTAQRRFTAVGRACDNNSRSG